MICKKKLYYIILYYIILYYMYLLQWNVTKTAEMWIRMILKVQITLCQNRHINAFSKCCIRT